MIKMIIADDEDIVRDGLESMVPWHELGIEVVGLAEDGEEALQLCRELKPDILCTDIRMPGMDGLELAQSLKEQGLAAKIVFISGIQDFHYAKTALSMHAEAYVLKPVKLPELMDVFQGVVSRIQMERDTEERYDKLRKQLHDSLPALREKLLVQLVSGYIGHEQEVYEKVGYYQLPLRQGERSVIGVLQIDDYEKAVKRYSEENKQLLFFAVHNVVQEVLNNGPHGIAFTNTLENELILVFSESSLPARRYIELADDMIRCIRQYLKISASIGIGAPARSVMEFRRSYLEAKEALQFTFFTGQGSVVTIDDIGNRTSQLGPFMQVYEIEKQLMIQLKLGDIEGVSGLMNKLFAEIIIPTSSHVEQVYHIGAELVFHLARTLHEQDESFEAIAGAPINEVLRVMEAKRDIEALREYMTDFIQTIASYMKNKHTTKNQKVVHRIQQYIDNHYMENVTIQRLAEEVYLSPTYMCQIFKQETGDTIIEFLTKVRVDKAKELLKSPDLKIFVIAEMVGFENATYFTTVFKKMTGMLPGKYRETL